MTGTTILKVPAYTLEQYQSGKAIYNYSLDISGPNQFVIDTTSVVAGDFAPANVYQFNVSSETRTSQVTVIGNGVASDYYSEGTKLAVIFYGGYQLYYYQYGPSGSIVLQYTNESLTVSTITEDIVNTSATLYSVSTGAPLLNGPGLSYNQDAFIITRSGDASVVDTVAFSVTGYGSNPASAADFGGALPSGSVLFNSGDVSKTVYIDIPKTISVGPDKQFSLAISGYFQAFGTIFQLATSNSPAVATINFSNDSYAVAATDAENLEGNTGTTPFTFTVTRTGSTQDTQTVSYSVAGTGTNPAGASHFGGILPSGTVTIPAGYASATITIPVTNDHSVDPDETFSVVISGQPNIAVASATGTILNDNSAYSIAATDADKASGTAFTTPFTFTIARTGYLGSAATLNYTVSGTGEHAADNYHILGLSGTVNFKQGESSEVLTIPIIGNTVIQSDETFVVTISPAASGPTTAIIAQATAIGTIINDNVEPPPSTTTTTTTGKGGLSGAVSPDPLFDAAYYLANNPDVAAAGVDPYQHYMTYGWKEGRNPSALFNTDYYENQNLDVKASGVNPLTHFETYGWKEGRDPSVAFSDSAYLAAYPDIKAAGIDPLLHYIEYGKTEGRTAFAATPHATGPQDPLVNAAYVYAHNPAVAAAGLDASAWYNSVGWKQGANPDAYFDTNYYLTQNPDVKAAAIDPLAHLEAYGWKEGRQPSLVFSDSAYLSAYSDIKAANVDPLLHYIQSGQTEGRMAFVTGSAAAADPLVNTSYYDAQLGATLIPSGTAGAQQAAYAYNSGGGWQAGLNPDQFFNTAYYLAHNPDVAAAHVDPLLHYELYGWKEGRNPSALFNTNAYLNANLDVKAAGVDPLLHYVDYGQAEGRAIYAAPT